MKLKCNNDPRLKLVDQFHQYHLHTNSYSLYKEAARYCTDSGLNFKCGEDELVVTTAEERISSIDEKSDSKIKVLLKNTTNNHNLQVILKCKWQGTILKSIVEDKTLKKGNFDWLSKWKTCPTSTVSEMMLLLYQTLGTKCYKKHCGPEGSNESVKDTICRLCYEGQESVMHLLSNCPQLAKKVYIQRHNNVLKCFIFQLLKKLKLIESAPQWFSLAEVKPQYENENYIVNWDIPEYSGRDGETVRDSARPDGKVVMKGEKKIFLVEQTVPWITNRDHKYTHKCRKYEEIQSFLRMENPGYEVDQITLVIDVFGGYSENLESNIGKVLNKEETTTVIKNMQRSVISSNAHLSRVFKIRTSSS